MFPYINNNLHEYYIGNVIASITSNILRDKNGDKNTKTLNYNPYKINTTY